MLKRYMLCLSFGLLLEPAGAAPVNATLDVTAAEISPGESVDLTWSVPAGAIGFLDPNSGVIAGPSSGSLRLKPSSSVDYVLVVQSGDLPPIFISRHVRVSGTKGSENEWHLIEPLSARIEYEVNRTSLVRYAQRVLRVLQDDRHFDVHEIQIEGRFIVGTKISQAAIPVDPEERPPKIRRIAYRVSLATADKALHVEITSEIDWRVPVLETWYPEPTDSKLCRQALSDLRGALTTAPKRE